MDKSKAVSITGWSLFAVTAAALAWLTWQFGKFMDALFGWE